jgi:hypothetical protein
MTKEFIRLLVKFSSHTYPDNPLIKINPGSDIFYNGGLGKLYQLFGGETEKIIIELNEELVA